MDRTMRQTSRISKAAGTPAGQIYRLEDMDVEEVSLVDRAANKKKFLVVKRDGDDMTIKKNTTTHLSPDGKGGFTASAAPATTTKAGLEVPPGFKQVAGPMLSKVGERLAALADVVDSASEAEVGDDGALPGVPGEFVAELGTIMGLLEKLGAMYPEAAPEMEEPEEGAAEEPPTEPAEMQMRLAADHLTKLVGKRQMTKALITKVGAKMSKDRLTRLQQAVSVLSNLVNEVAGAPPVPAGAPPVGKLAPTQKSASADPMLTAMQAQLTELVGVVGGLAGIVKQTQTGLHQVQKTRGTPTGGQVEGGAPAPTTPLSWPMDMNNEITRETVGKNESFFDD